MRTRSMNAYPNIDFDEAHDAWIQNKKSIGNGMYVYICGKPLKSGKLCCRREDTCSIHKNWNKEKD